MSVVQEWRRCWGGGCVINSVYVIDVAEMFGARGFAFTREAIRDGETRFAPLRADQLRTKRWGPAGKSWDGDETSITVHGTWCYLSRAIASDGNRVRFSAQ
jgi:transposase-like protein